MNCMFKYEYYLQKKDQITFIEELKDFDTKIIIQQNFKLNRNNLKIFDKNFILVNLKSKLEDFYFGL